MKKIVIGIIILLFGIFLLFYNLGFLPWNIYHIVVSWQMLLIAIGAALTFDKSPSNKSGGIFLIFLGVVLIIPRIFNDISLTGILIPSVIILGGIFFIVQAVLKRNDNNFFERKNFENFNEMPYVENPVNGQEYIKREYVFSGSKERWTYGRIKKVEISAVFSAVEIDFLDAELSPEVDTVFIKVSSVFSGVTLYVPDNWNIMVQKTGVFGGFSDKRAPHSVPLGGKVVILELEAIFGGGELKYYEQ